MLTICPACNYPIELPPNAVHSMHRACYDRWIANLYLALKKKVKATAAAGGGH